MAILMRLTERNVFSTLYRLPGMTAGYATASRNDEQVIGEFRVFQLRPKKSTLKLTQIKEAPVPPPRAKRMPTNQDWVSVWPGPRSFHPDSVPLPIRQGFPRPREAPPSKYGNAELMKIPNFLHLTPPAIARHCEALKKFCTEWPASLETEEKCAKHFPLEVITSDYCYAGPSIRDPLSRIVSLRVKLSSLKLDAHAKDKLLRLLGNRYNPETDLITITADRCPMRKQNLEYAEYLLIAVYNEAWRVEAWEAEKTLADMEYYDWEKHKSRQSLVATYAWPENPPEDLKYDNIPHVEEYKVAITELMNNGEDSFSIEKYHDAVKNLLHLRKAN